MRRALLLVLALVAAAVVAGGRLAFSPRLAAFASSESGVASAFASGPAPGPSSESNTVAAGRAVYCENCARCHGEKGEGVTAQPLIGETNRLQSFPTAAALFQYVRLLMPLDAPGSLSEEDYWAVLSYVLVRNGIIDEQFALGPETAEDVSLRP